MSTQDKNHDQDEERAVAINDLANEAFLAVANQIDGVLNKSHSLDLDAQDAFHGIIRGAMAGVVAPLLGDDTNHRTYDPIFEMVDIILPFSKMDAMIRAIERAKQHNATLQ